MASKARRRRGADGGWEGAGPPMRSAPDRGVAPMSAQSPPHTAPTGVAVPPRQATWEFPADVPSLWFGGSPALTAMLDAFTLTIPDNERYYIRVLQRCLPRVDDPGLRNELANFIRQEALHGI